MKRDVMRAAAIILGSSVIVEAKTGFWQTRAGLSQGLQAGLRAGLSEGLQARLRAGAGMQQLSWPCWAM